MTYLEEIGASPEDYQDQSLDEDNSDEEIDIELRRQIEDLQTIVIYLKAEIEKKETEIVKKDAKIDQTRKRVKNAEKFNYCFLAVLLIVIVVGAVFVANAKNEKSNLDQRLTDLESDLQILREKYEQEMVALRMQAQDEEKRNKNFDLCISGSHILKHAATFAAGWFPGAQRIIENLSIKIV
jgi:hypothetical protein